MPSRKTTAAIPRVDVKIAELGAELGVDPREIVKAAKEMAMDNAKVPASWVTAGQADRLRAKFGGQQELKDRLARQKQFHESALQPTPVRGQGSGVRDQESGVRGQETAPAKINKKTYEKDRRAAFGVVTTPGGMPVADPRHSAPGNEKKLAEKQAGS